MKASMSGLSVNEFRKLIKNEVEAICTKRGLKEPGHGFQIWVNNLISKIDRTVEEAGDSPLSGDGGVDGFLSDDTRKFAYLTSCKYQSEKKPVDRELVNSFFSKHSQLLDKKWIKSLKNITAQDYLSPYAEMHDENYQFRYIFISTGEASDEIYSLTESKNDEYQRQGVPVFCEIWDFSRLKEEYDRAEKLERQLPEDIELNFQNDKFIELNLGRRTIIGAIKGNEVKNLFKAKGDSLFAYNIRSFLGSRGINTDITKTANNVPENFFYFNNGITAICTDYEIENENKIIVKGFQIINGAQTVGALSKAKNQADLYVQFRLIEAESVKTETGVNKEIIRWNNTQNPVKLSDFRSNDAIQSWLENQFRLHRWKNKEYIYSAKRGLVLKGAVGLEEMSKILCAFSKQDPPLVFSSPKALWSKKEDDGIYEELFGDGHSEVNSWSPERFYATAFAVTSLDLIEDKINAEIKSNPELKFLKRLRYHSLGLVSILLKDKERISEFSDKSAHEFIERFWPDIKRVIIDQHLNHVVERNMTLFSFVRNSTEVWSGMKKRILSY
jgi:hypothetical protein